MNLVFIIWSLTFLVPSSIGLLAEIQFNIGTSVLIIQPKGLGLAVHFPDSEAIPIVPPTHAQFGEPSLYDQTIPNELVIQYTNALKVNMSIHQGSFCVRIHSTIDQIIQWPSIYKSPLLKAYLIPEGEGLYVPMGDKVIWDIIETDEDMGLSVPFSGYLYKDFSLTLIFRTFLRTSYRFLKEEQHFAYDFRQRDKQPFYELSFTFANPDALAPSKVFRSHLQESGQLQTLAQKMVGNPNIAKLGGAIHAYIWGDGRTTPALIELRKLGIERIWLGYLVKGRDYDPADPTDFVDAEYIKTASDFGYLIGPYDSWHTMQRQNESDPATDFGPTFFPYGCVLLQDGSINPGFAKRGCHVSMTALAQINNSIVYNRFEGFKKEGINSYFLDAHATGEVFDDYSPIHPQTQFQDLDIRIQQLKYLEEHGVVVGSETAGAWSIPFLGFSHGSFSTLYNLHWELVKNKSYGNWSPSKRPGQLFKSLIADDLYATRYDPKYRIPMWQGVSHDVSISVDRWEIPLLKFPNLYVDRFLLEFLYGVPCMWSLDLKLIKDFGHILKQMAEEFSPVHKMIMTEKLSDFQWLANDRTVQRTTFGDLLTITGNFRDSRFQDIPPKSLKMQWLKTGLVRYVTPQSLILEE